MGQPPVPRKDWIRAHRRLVRALRQAATAAEVVAGMRHEVWGDDPDPVTLPDALDLRLAADDLERELRRISRS